MRFPGRVSREDHTAKPLKSVAYLQFPAFVPTVLRTVDPQFIARRAAVAGRVKGCIDRWPPPRAGALTPRLNARRCAIDRRTAVLLRLLCYVIQHPP